MVRIKKLQVSGSSTGPYHRYKIETEGFTNPPRGGYDWFVAAIDNIWQSNERRVAMDWGGMETFIVDVLKSNKLMCEQKIALLMEGVDAFTGRGHFR